MRAHESRKKRHSRAENVVFISWEGLRLTIDYPNCVREMLMKRFLMRFQK